MRSGAPLPIPKADSSWRIAIVHSSFYKEEMAALVRSAADALREAGIADANVIVAEAAGSFEVPLIGEVIAHEGKVDALIGLGIVVEGGTHHARLLAEAAARGIMDVQLRHRIPFAFEILYVDTLALARERLDKGREAAAAVLHSLAELRRLRS